MHRSFLSPLLVVLAAATRTGWARVTAVSGAVGEDEVVVRYVVFDLLIYAPIYIYIIYMDDFLITFFLYSASELT